MVHTSTGAGVEAEEMKQADLKAKADLVGLMYEMLEEGRRLSGDPDMEPLQALAYLAERGDKAASALLHAITGAIDSQNTITAAAEHPDWELEGFKLRCTDETCTENTPDKLLAWYRDKRIAS